MAHLPLEIREVAGSYLEEFAEKRFGKPGSGRHKQCNTFDINYHEDLPSKKINLIDELLKYNWWFVSCQEFDLSLLAHLQVAVEEFNKIEEHNFTLSVGFEDCRPGPERRITYSDSDVKTSYFLVTASPKEGPLFLTLPDTIFSEVIVDKWSNDYLQEFPYPKNRKYYSAYPEYHLTVEERREKLDKINNYLGKLKEIEDTRAEYVFDDPNYILIGIEEFEFEDAGYNEEHLIKIYQHKKTGQKRVVFFDFSIYTVKGTFSYSAEIVCDFVPQLTSSSSQSS